MTPLQVTRVAGFGKKPPQSFSQSPVVLGTGAGSSVRFDAAWDKGVAAQHVKLEWINNYWSLSDMGSPSGTWINGHKLTQAYPVTEPIEIELGKGGPRCQVEPLAAPAGQPAAAPAYAAASTQRPAPVYQTRQSHTGISAPVVALIAGVVVLVAAGAAYYFLDYREAHQPLDAVAANKVILPPGPGENPVNPPAPVPAPNPGPNPTPSPAPSPSPGPEPVTDHPLEPSVLPDDDGQSGATRTMGLIAHTPEQQAWSRQHFPSAAGVKLNQIGVERMRSNSYAVEGPAAPLGDEIVTRKPGSSTFANESGEDDITPAKLPVAVDNSTRSTFPGVGDQMALNSCVSYSSVYYACANNLAVARGLNAPVRLSPMWVFTMINGGENTGSNLENAYLLLQNHGAPPMEMMRYPDPQNDPGANTANPPAKYYRPWSTDPAVWRAALHNRIGAIGTFDDLDTPAGLQRLKAYLANGYLANYSTDIADEEKQVAHDGWNANWTVAKSNPALSAEGNAAAGQPVLCCAGACDGGHAMTIVGYNDDVWVDYNNDGIVQPQEKGALKVVNSWGKDGFPRKRDGGFAWISYDALRDHSQFPWIEAKNRVPVIEDKQAWYMLPDKEEEKSPVLAQFTLSNAHRNEVDVRLGISSLSAKEPEYNWRPAMLTVSDYPSKYRLSQDTAMGGPFAFDGGDQEIDGTFVFDLMTLVHNFGNAKGFRLYLIVTDLKSGNPTTVKDFCITDPDGKIIARCEGLAQPVSIDKSSATFSIDCAP